MHISNNDPQTFGSIQVNLSRMNRNQMRVCDRFFNSIKYNDKYSQLTSDIKAGEDIDIYILPRIGRGIEIRFMDPYSGYFVRKDKLMIKENLFTVLNSRVEEVTDKIVDLYEKIKNGTIARPKEDIHKFIREETELDRINPAKKGDLSESIEEYKKLGYSENKARRQAFEVYKSLYHIDNRDADF